MKTQTNLGALRALAAVELPGGQVRVIRFNQVVDVALQYDNPDPFGDTGLDLHEYTITIKGVAGITVEDRWPVDHDDPEIGPRALEE